jgi:Zn-dependent peptidase ImmA (M78 family)
MSDRYLKTDIFWFSFFHEIAHVLFHLHKKDDVFINLESEEEQVEREANEWASDFLLPKEKFHALLVQSLITEDLIVDFARENGISASIVAGRLGHHFDQPNIWKILTPLRKKLEFTK